MTIETATPTQLHPIAGTGPYGTTWPYAEGSIAASVVQANGVLLPLTPGSDFTVSPLSTTTAGDITLSGPIAATHAGRQLFLERGTPAEQGWVGNLSAREKGLETQLDILTMGQQELRSAAARSLKTTAPIAAFAPGADGTALMWQAGGIAQGPTADEIADAQNAALVATSAAATATAAAASINSRAVDNTAALKALDTTVWRAAFIRAGANQGLYFWAAGDFTLQHTEEAGADLFFVKADAIAITAGCWVRFVIKPDKADWHYSRAIDGSIALEVRAQGEAVSWLGVQQGNNAGGGTTPYGPTIYTEGIYTSADLNVALKGTGKAFIGGDEGIILQLEPRGDGYVTDRVPILRPGAVGASTYAQLLSAGGVEIGANGFPVFQVLGGAGDGTALLTLTPSSNNTLSLFASSGDSLSITAAGGLFLNSITSRSLTSTTFTVASGATVNLNPFSGLHNINPITNPIATLTINFPAAPSNGQELRVSFSNTVTAITWASLGGHVIRGEEASGTPENPQNFVYITGIGWVRS